MANTVKRQGKRRKPATTSTRWVASRYGAGGKPKNEGALAPRQPKALGGRRNF